MAARPRRQAVIETQDDEPETPTVDETQEQDTLSGAIPEGELQLARSVAKRMGWTPQEEWTRDPEKWEDAPSFLENTPKVLQALKERSERTARAAAEAIEEERRRAREEATRVIETSEDPAERRKAAEQLAQNAGPPPETRAWLARNPWFETDPDAQMLARGTVDRLARSGASIAEQLTEAENVVRRRFPEYFANGGEQRLSDVRRQTAPPPQVQQGNRSTTTQPKEKGFAQIPRADREAFQNHLLRAYMSRGLTQQAAEAKYAEGYWRAPPVDPSERGQEPYPLKPQSNIWASRRGRTQ